MMSRGLSRTVWAIIAVVIIVIVALGAYYYVKSTTTAKPVTLVVVAYSGTTANFIQFAGELFHEEHPNVYVKVITYPFSQYVTNELTVLEAHSPEYDIIEFTSTSSLRFVPYVVPLNSYIGTLFNMSDLMSPQEAFGGEFYNTTTGQIEYIGIAYETVTYMLAYKCSIFNNQTLAQEFYNKYGVEFNPLTWQNWTTVLYVDQFLTSHGITKYGVLVDDHVSHGIIDAYPAIFGWWYMRDPNLNKGRIGGLPNFNILFYGAPAPGCTYPLPDFNTTDGIEALEVYKELVSYEPPPNVTPITYDNLPELYAEYAPAAMLFVSQLSYLPSSVYNDTCLAPLPGGYAETGTNFLAVSKYSTHKQLALEFLAFLVSPQVQVYEYLYFHKFPISKEAFQMLLSNSSLSQHDRELLEAVYDAAEYAWANPPNIPPTYPELIPSFNQEVYAYLLGQVNATTAMNTAAAAWINALVQTYGTCPGIG